MNHRPIVAAGSTTISRSMLGQRRRRIAVVDSQARVLQAHAFTTYTNLTAGLDNYVRFYNHDRRHSSLGMISPIDFEIKSLTSQQSS